jgi:metal-sulfur cluster biosynthetic enzyme
VSQDENINKPHWKADDSHPELMEALRSEFRQIFDPEINLNIIQLGLIRDVEMDDQGATLTMILTTPFCPYGPSMMETTRQKAESVLKVPTHIAYGEIPWDFSLMEDGLADDWGLF